MKHEADQSPPPPRGYLSFSFFSAVFFNLCLFLAVCFRLFLCVPVSVYLFLRRGSVHQSCWGVCVCVCCSGMSTAAPSRFANVKELSTCVSSHAHTLMGVDKTHWRQNWSVRPRPWWPPGRDPVPPLRLQLYNKDGGTWAVCELKAARVCVHLAECTSFNRLF